MRGIQRITASQGICRNPLTYQTCPLRTIIIIHDLGPQSYHKAQTCICYTLNITSKIMLHHAGKIGNLTCQTPNSLYT